MFMKRLIKVEKRRAAPAVQKLAIKKGRDIDKSQCLLPGYGALRPAVYITAIAVHPLSKKNAKKEEQLALLFKLYAPDHVGLPGPRGLPREFTDN